MIPGKDLPPMLRRLVETWVEAHESELLEQWNFGDAILFSNFGDALFFSRLFEAGRLRKPNKIGFPQSTPIQGGNMTREQILEFLNANPVCHLATCEGKQPRVRGMMMYRADSTGLVFHTGNYKALTKQLLANKLVEVCFNSQDTQVRVAGVAEIVEDMGFKKEIVEARPFLKPWVEEHGYDLLVVFRVTQCQAAVWTMATNFEPTQYQKL
jgi:pyridoxamine 5'-phosphate oxidase